MLWTRKLFRAPAESQMYIGDATIVQLKQCIVGSAGVRKGSELYAVQWMNQVRVQPGFRGGMRRPVQEQTRTRALVGKAADFP